jgi:hypothetical protein
VVDNGGQSEGEEFRGARIRISGTNPVTPKKGRIFVWTKIGWFERLEGPLGNVAFTHVADSEEELRELISSDNPQADLYEVGGKNRKQVSEEFLEQSRSYSDSPEDSSEEPDEDDQEYHQHGLS